MGRLRPSILVFSLCIAVTSCLNVVYDETYWTKATWSEWKVAYTPQQNNIKSDVLERFPELRQSSHNSLEGPFSRVSSLDSTSSEHPTTSEDVDALDDSTYVEFASHSAQCSVCGVLAKYVWDQLSTNATKGQEYRGRDVAALLEDTGAVCEKVASLAAAKHTVLKIESQANSGAAVLFFVLRDRRAATAPTVQEKEAMLLACQAVLPEVRDVLVSEATQQLQKMKVAAEGILSSHGIGVDDEYDDGDEECLDLHPSCRSWALAGECEANPAYMVGNERQMGACKKSCDACGLKDWMLNKDAVAEMTTASNNLLAILRQAVCAASHICMAGGSNVGTGSGGTSKPLGAGGFELGRPWHGRPKVTIVPPPSRVKLASPQSKVDEVLVSELHGKKLSIISSNFFINEFVYKKNMRQFHEEPNGEVTENYSLGKFNYQDTDEGLVLEDLDKLPDRMRGALKMKQWPYVRQMYTGGDECVLAQGRRVRRQTEVRIACSPDSHMHMLLREPDYCQYVLVLYVPGLCQVEGYAPLDKPAE